MRLAIDTNRYSDLCRGHPDVVEVVTHAEEVHVPLIVLAELRAGFICGSRREDNESHLTRFLNKERVQVLLPDQHTTFVYADLYAYLRRKGKPVPTNDLWIAALVVQHGLLLLDRDRDFDHLPQVPRIPLDS